MAKMSMKLKQQAAAQVLHPPYNRCKICGRPHAYLRDYGICRICFRSWPTRARSPACGRLPGNLCAATGVPCLSPTIR